MTSDHTPMAAVLAELRTLRAEIAELRRELAEVRDIAAEAGDHTLHVRNILDTTDLRELQ